MIRLLKNKRGAFCGMLAALLFAFIWIGIWTNYKKTYVNKHTGDIKIVHEIYGLIVEQKVQETSFSRLCRSSGFAVTREPVWCLDHTRRDGAWWLSISSFSRHGECAGLLHLLNKIPLLIESGYISEDEAGKVLEDSRHYLKNEDLKGMKKLVDQY